MPWLTVKDNVGFGLPRQLPRAERERRAAAEIARVGLTAFADALPKTLSGGMAQRAALARALVTRPAVLLLDEPFSALDALTRQSFQEELVALWERDRPTMLLVTHDLDEALFLADRVVVLGGQPGRVRLDLSVPLPRGPGRATACPWLACASGCSPSCPMGRPPLCPRLPEPETVTMNVEQLRELQAPIKSRYRDDPEAAVVTLRAKGEIGQDGLACRVETGRALVEAGLHPASGGTGLQACSGDMLLEALAACAGVTLLGGSDGLGHRGPQRHGDRRGRSRFRGTLGVAKDAPVGFRAIRLDFALDTDASEEQLASLLKLTERYCVVLQTLRVPAEFNASLTRAA